MIHFFDGDDVAMPEGEEEDAGDDAGDDASDDGAE